MLTSASWLNPVERLLSESTNQRLRRGIFHSVANLQAAINRYLAQAHRAQAVRVDQEPRHDHPQA